MNIRNYQLLIVVFSIPQFLYYIIDFDSIYLLLIESYNQNDFYNSMASFIAIFLPVDLCIIVIVISIVVKRVKIVGISLIVIGVVAFIFDMYLDYYVASLNLFLLSVIIISSGIFALKWKPKEVQYF